MSHRLFSSPLQVLVLWDYKTHYVCSRTHTHSLQNKRWKGKQHKLCWQQADTSDCRSVSESLSADTLTLTQHDCEQVQAQGMTQIQSACQDSNYHLTAQQRALRRGSHGGGEGRRTGKKGRDNWVNKSTSQQKTRVRQVKSLFTGQFYNRLVNELTAFSCQILLVAREENRTDAETMSTDCERCAKVQHILSSQPDRLYTPTEDRQRFGVLHHCVLVTTGPVKAPTTAAACTQSGHEKVQVILHHRPRWLNTHTQETIEHVINDVSIADT